MKTLRIFNAILLLAMVAGAVVTYGMKHNAEVAADTVTRLQADIAGEKDKIRTLNAEWAYLTQPSRIEAVVTEHADYFQLKPFTPDQIASIADIPMRAAPGSVPAATAGNGAASPDDAAVRAALARIAAGGALRTR